MAETPSKRQREETHVAEDDEDSSKLHKSYTHHILSLLEEDEAEPNQDFSSILSTLQRELSSDFTVFDDPLFPHRSEAERDPENPTPGPSSELSPALHGGLKGDEEEEDERERVMRHLLEASDDELGIPHRVDGGGDDDGVINGGDAFALCDGLWELEDEAANYYTLMQSELFM